MENISIEKINCYIADEPKQVATSETKLNRNMGSNFIADYCILLHQFPELVVIHYDIYYEEIKEHIHNVVGSIDLQVGENRMAICKPLTELPDGKLSDRNICKGYKQDMFF